MNDDARAADPTSDRAWARSVLNIGETDNNTDQLRERRHRRLGEFVDELEERNGPVDEGEVQRFMDLLR